MITDLRKMWRRLETAIGYTPTRPYDPPSLGCRPCRVGFCSAMLQLTDNGQPISQWTVAQRMGHADLSMVSDVYGHLGEFRLRGEHLDFRHTKYDVADEITALYQRQEK